MVLPSLCRSYMLAYNSHHLKDTFNIHSLDLKAVAKSFGFSTPPRVSIPLESKAAHTRKAQKSGQGADYRRTKSGTYGLSSVSSLPLKPERIRASLLSAIALSQATNSVPPTPMERARALTNANLFVSDVSIHRRPAWSCFRALRASATAVEACFSASFSPSNSSRAAVAAVAACSITPRAWLAC